MKQFYPKLSWICINNFLEFFKILVYCGSDKGKNGTNEYFENLY